MLDLVGNSEDRFSHNEAHIKQLIVRVFLFERHKDMLHELRHEKTYLWSFQPSQTQIRHSHRLGNLDIDFGVILLSRGSEKQRCL